MKLASNDFVNGGKLPKVSTCYGDGASPHLAFEDTDEEKIGSFALIMEQIDESKKPLKSYWLLYNIPRLTIALPPAIPPAAVLNKAMVHGFNDFNEIGYMPPCPKKKAYYRFTLYALNKRLNDPSPGLNKEQLMELINDLVVKKASLECYALPE